MVDTTVPVRAAVSSAYAIDTEMLSQDEARIAQTASAGSLADARALYTDRSRPIRVGLVRNLEEKQFSAYSPDSDIRDRLIEQNFDDVMRYIPACAAMRQESADLAKFFMETGLKSEEFFRLDDIHQQEVSAGLYDLPHREADDKVRGLAAAVAAVDSQATTIATLENSGPLSQTERDTYVSNAGDLAYATTNVDRNDAKDRSGKLARYRSDLDVASWNYNEQGVLANIAQLQAELETATRKAAYYRQDVSFRSARAAVSRQLAYAQLGENARRGSILNYAERLERVRLRFNDALDRLVPRVLALGRAAHELYQLPNLPLNPGRGRILDDILDWVQKFQDLLVRYRRKERIFLFSISLRRDTPAAVSSLKSTSGASFNLTPVLTRNQNGLLRGMAFEYLPGSTGSRRPIIVDAVAPPTTTQNLRGGSSPPTSLTFGRVLPIPNSLELRPQHSDIVWNGVPYSTWTFSINERVYNDADVEDLVVYLWLAFPS
jgi:hypothetical protein